MSKAKKIRLIYGLCLSVLTVVVGVAFIIEAADIYYGGKADSTSPYTVDTVRSHLILPLILLSVWVAAAIIGYVLSVIYPSEEKLRVRTNYAASFSVLKVLIPREGEDFADTRNTLQRMSLTRRTIWGAVFALLTASGVYMAVYIFDPAHYHTDAIGNDILALVRNIIWWGVACLVGICFALIYDNVSLRKEVDIARNALKGGRHTPQTNTTAHGKAAVVVTASISVVAVGVFAALPAIATALSHYMSKGGEYSYAVTLSVALILLVVTVTATILFSRYSRDIPLSARKPIHMAIAAVVCTISVVYLMVGIFNGGARDVFIKAVNICTECIGLG